MSIEIMKNYRDNEELRASFNELAKKVFKLSFENWYQNGYWKDNYNPYSVVVDGKVVANVSVNQMYMMMNGEKKHFIQLGTVMTDPEYRGRGFMNELMKEVDKDWLAQCDGIYLFANDSVLDFYPKYGYYVEKQYQYSKNVDIVTERTIKNVSMREKEDWDKMKAIVDENQAFYEFDMIDNSELAMFYLSQFMKENVYYVENLNAYVVAEEDDEELILHSIFAEKKVSIDKVITAFGSNIKKVILGFTPDEKDTYECNEFNEKNTTLFVKGLAFEGFADRHFMFTPISHA